MRILLIAAFLFLAACDDRPSREISNSYNMPPGLEDCRVYKVKAIDGDYNLYVTRCGDVTSTGRVVSCGKGCSRILTNTLEEQNHE